MELAIKMFVSVRVVRGKNSSLYAFTINVWSFAKGKTPSYPAKPDSTPLREEFPNHCSLLRSNQ